MIKEINGHLFFELIDYGIRNLTIHKEQVNALNVFPVPDGDTGTNMLVTMQCGLAAVHKEDMVLSQVAKQFARAITFGARGNSGVILSQFFKGLSELFYDREAAEYPLFISALENGVKCAYQAVPQPMEGTILTVVREATEHVREKYEKGSIQNYQDVLNCFLEEARCALERTPELLAVLKSAGVVDSGGAGLIHVFEGMEKCLNHETLPEAENTDKKKQEDYSRFNRDSVFKYGYCTELLLQLVNGKARFQYAAFQKEISRFGDSLVTVFEDDKLKLHIHTFSPEMVLSFCHQYGEFLNLKIENMSVQHQELYADEQPLTSYGEGNPFSVVAVAHNRSMERYFREMGADHVILTDYQTPPAAADFMEVFALSQPDTVLVFPNNKNTELAAVQAQRLCKDKQIVIVGGKNDAHCFAALPMIDFSSTDIGDVVAQVESVMENMDLVLVTQTQKTTCFDGECIQCGDYIATSEQVLQAVGTTLAEAVQKSIRRRLLQRECDVITMFASNSVPEEAKDEICQYVSEHYPYTEITVVDTDDIFYEIVLSFE